jgi:hypothetical protein
MIPSIRQIPTVNTLIGGAIVLGGVLVAAGGSSRRSTPDA